jgi:hypothetical protein
MSDPGVNYLEQAWGWPDEVSGIGFSGASNIVVGTNPPYSVSDFLNVYPKFGGTPTITTATLTTGSPNVTVALATGLAAGQLVAAAGIPGGTTILSVAGSVLTLSANATASATNQNVTVFTAPFVSLYVLNMYITLASASLVQARWLERWPLGMALFIAHYASLFMQSDGGVYSTAGQAAIAGLQQGITTSKAVGPVSESMQPLGGLEDWGEWNLTTYGIQLASQAKVVGGGPMYVR